MKEKTARKLLRRQRELASATEKGMALEKAGLGHRVDSLARDLGVFHEDDQKRMDALEARLSALEARLADRLVP